LAGSSSDVRINQQSASGLFFLAFGALYFWLASDLTMGDAADMGIGYTPRLLSFGCVAVGAFLLGGAALGRHGVLGGPVTLSLRPLLLITTMTAGFGLVLPWLGLPLTVAATVLAASLSGEHFRPLPLILIAAGLAIGTTILFAWILNLQLPIFPVMPGRGSA
jgi:hypothetical protein